MRCRKYCNKIQPLFDLTGQHIDFRDPVDLIAKKFYPVRIIIRIRRKNLKHIAAHPESAAVKIHLIPIILNIDQFAQHLVPIAFLPLP